MEEELLQNSNLPSTVGNAYGQTDEAMGTEVDAISDFINSTVGIEALQKPMPQSQILPPNFYEPDRGRSVIGGYVEGLPLMSAGIPMFSAAILQKADEDLKAAKMMEYEQKMGEAENLIKTTQPLHINDDFKNQQFLDYQNTVWTKTLNDLKGQYGVNAAKMGRVEIQKTAAKLKGTQTAFNNAYKMSQEIMFKADNRFVHPDVKKEAEAFLRDTFEGNFKEKDIDGLSKDIGKVTQKLLTYQNMTEVAKPFLDGVKGLSLTEAEMTVLDSFGKDKLVGGTTYKGIAALANNEEFKAQYTGLLQDLYNNKYAGKEYAPTYQQFEDNAMLQAANETVIKYEKLSLQAPRSTSDSGDRKLIDNTKSTSIKVGNSEFNLTNLYTPATPRDVTVESMNVNWRSIAEGKPVTQEQNENIKIQAIVEYEGIPYVVGLTKYQTEDENTGEVKNTQGLVFAPLTNTALSLTVGKDNLTHQYRASSSKEENAEYERMTEQYVKTGLLNDIFFRAFGNKPRGTQGSGTTQPKNDKSGKGTKKYNTFQEFHQATGKTYNEWLKTNN